MSDSGDTTLSPRAAEDPGAGDAAADDGSERAMSEHVDRADRMVGDTDVGDGEPDEAADAIDADDVDFDSGAVEEQG